MGQLGRDSSRLLGLWLRAGFWLCLCDICMRPAWCVSVCVVCDVVERGPGHIQPRVAPAICLGLPVLGGGADGRTLFERI